MYNKEDIIKHAKKYIRDRQVKKAFVEAVNTDQSEGHVARIITESLCERHPRSKKLSELDTMVTEYYFG